MSKLIAGAMLAALLGTAARADEAITLSCTATDGGLDPRRILAAGTGTRVVDFLADLPERRDAGAAHAAKRDRHRDPDP